MGLFGSPSILLIVVNSSNDRETPGYTASEYASTILEMLRRYDKPRRPHVITSDQRANRLITHVVYLEGGNVRVDETAMKVRSGFQSPLICRAWGLYSSKYLGIFMVGRMAERRSLRLMPSSGR